MHIYLLWPGISIIFIRTVRRARHDAGFLSPSFIHFIYFAVFAHTFAHMRELPPPPLTVSKKKRLLSGVRVHTHAVSLFTHLCMVFCIWVNVFSSSSCFWACRKFDGKSIVIELNRIQSFLDKRKRKRQTNILGRRKVIKSMRIFFAVLIIFIQKFHFRGAPRILFVRNWSPEMAGPNIFSSQKNPFCCWNRF